MGCWSLPLVPVLLLLHGLLVRAAVETEIYTHDELERRLLQGYHVIGVSDKRQCCSTTPTAAQQQHLPF
jgi:hypothetical protein